MSFNPSLAYGKANAGINFSQESLAALDSRNQQAYLGASEDPDQLRQDYSRFGAFLAGLAEIAQSLLAESKEEKDLLKGLFHLASA